jgi:hypothetical protein
MRRRINRTLFTATAASASLIGLSFMAAGGAGAATNSLPVNGPSGGAPIITNTTCTPVAAAAATTPTNCGMAGYQASNRLFRYAQASIVVPDHIGIATTTDTAANGASSDASLYVALDNNSNTALDYARVGVVPICTTVTAGACAAPTAAIGTSGWEIVAQTVEPDPTATIATSTPVVLPTGDEGVGIFFSVFLSPSGNSVHTVASTPATTSTTGNVTTTTAGSTYNHTFAVHGPNYTDAQALADWTGPTATAQIEPVPPVAANVAAYTQFFDGRFTTLNGTKGTFNGAWTVNPVEANQTGGAVNVAGPSYLWTNDKYPGDAFGVWIYGGTPAT